MGHTLTLNSWTLGLSTTVVDSKVVAIRHSDYNHTICNVTLQHLPPRNRICFTSSWILTDFVSFFGQEKWQCDNSEPRLPEAWRSSILSPSTLSSSHMNSRVRDLMAYNCIMLAEVILGESIAIWPLKRTKFPTRPTANNKLTSEPNQDQTKHPAHLQTCEQY